MQPKISVALATYNGEKYIRAQLESLARQTTLPFELVVCDDCSRDDTVEIIREFCNSAPFPIRLYLNDANIGWSENFCKSASLCRGDWIAFCDQDDVWLPNKLSSVQEVLSSDGDDELMLVSHSALVANEELELTGHRFPDYARDVRAKRGDVYALLIFYGYSMVCRASLIKQINPARRPFDYLDLDRNPAPVPLSELRPTRVGHDFWTGALAAALGDIALISEPLVIWRRHDSSITPTDYSSRAIAAEDVFGQARAAYREHLRNLSGANPNYYMRFSILSDAFANSFLCVRHECGDPNLERRLSAAAKKIRRLAQVLSTRATLYRARSFMHKIAAFHDMLRINAYFGQRYNSLGWRSFAKDLYFTLGLSR